MLYFLAIIIPLIITYGIKKYLLQILNKPICLRENYKKDKIPVCGGIIFIPTMFLSVLILNILSYKDNYIFLYLIAVIIMSYVGLLDDLLGDRSVTGLKGHLKMLLHGKLTTGGLKAIMGFLVAFTVSLNINNNGFVDVIINTFIVALFTNFINLLDLRPGRAGKAFFILSIIFLIYGKGSPFFLIILLCIVIIYLPSDLKSSVMMGDTGSNVLGVSLGIASIMIFRFNIRIIVLALLILMHLMTEKYSLTEIIEKNRILNYIDMLGRK